MLTFGIPITFVNVWTVFEIVRIWLILFG